jgi:hypothetical protein
MKIGASDRHRYPSAADLSFSKTLFMRGFMMDGNFQAEHMKMRNPENDVPLSDGTGFMVSPIPYKAHLKSAVEMRQVRSIFGTAAGGAQTETEINVPRSPCSKQCKQA